MIADSQALSIAQKLTMNRISNRSKVSSQFYQLLRKEQETGPIVNFVFSLPSEISPLQRLCKNLTSATYT